jgi:hypothetical protein
MKLIDVGSEFHGGIGVASKWLGDTTPLDPSNPSHVAAVQAQFGAHALLANWDAIGLGFDNTVIGPQGQAIMVDPGGALAYRAMGKPKGTAFGPTVGEVDTLRDPKINPTAAKIFGPMTESAMAESMLDAATGYKYGQGATMSKIIADHMWDSAAAANLHKTMNARASDLLGKGKDLEAQNASTSTLDIATTGTTTGILEHHDPHVQQLIGASSTHLDHEITNGNDAFDQVSANLESKSGTYYKTKLLDPMKALANAGDVDALTKSDVFNYNPVTQSAKLSQNYGAYLKAKQHALAIAQAQAAKKVQAQGKPGDGSLLTGAAKVTAPVIAAAKAVEHMPPSASVQSLALAPHLPTRSPKPAAQPVTKIPPAMPKTPILSSPSNPNVKLTKQAALIEEYAKHGGADAAAKIQAVSSQITGSNGYSQKAKQWAADVVAALGGQPHIDAMPVAAKRAAMETALVSGATTIKHYGTLTIEERQSVVKFDPSQIPEPPSFANWKGPGKPLYNSEPHLNAINDATVQSMFSAAKSNDLAKLQSIDPGPSKHTTQYKTGLLGVLANVGTVTTKSKLISTQAGGKVDGAQVAKDLGQAFKAKASWSADAENFHKFVVAGKTDAAMAKAVFASIPAHKLTTSHQETGNLLTATHSKIGDSGNAAGVTQSIISYTANGYKKMNNELRDGVKGTPAFEEALGHAKNVEKALSPVPVGLVLSRKANIGSFTDWSNQIGKIISEPGITSTSINPKKWSGSIGFKLKVGAGVTGAYVGPASKSVHEALSSNATEAELILPRNTKWYIANVKKNTGDDDFFSHGSYDDPSTIVEIVVMPHDAIAGEG